MALYPEQLARETTLEGSDTGGAPIRQRKLGAGSSKQVAQNVRRRTKFLARVPNFLDGDPLDTDHQVSFLY